MNHVMYAVRSGFTLVELLVVAGITAFLAGMLLVYGSSGREQTTLYVEQAKIVQIIARAKSLAVSTLNRTSAPCGYGVAFHYGSSTYELFRYDIDGDCKDILDPTGFGITSQGGDPTIRYERLEGFVLPAEVVFESGNNSLVYAFFMPPDPSTGVFTSAGTPPVPTASVVLKGRKGVDSLVVTVTRAGQISF